MRVNNYFDGPFDQLPDNFIEGEALRKAILAVSPELKGRVDRLGGDASGDIRFSIDPYRPYLKVDDLYPIHRCATAKRATASYYACFSGELGGMPEDAPSARPKGRSTRRAKGE